ncbi:MAG: MOSC domain-containing protein [Pseudomonadota bacterium]
MGAQKLIGVVRSLHVGAEGELGKVAKEHIAVEIDGIVGDRHRGYERETWPGDKQPAGTRRRNERQWSAVSAEELSEISEAMDLTMTLSAADLGANLCLEGIPELSRLPKGTLLKFPSGAELIVEEYNPPCHDMGKKIAASYETRSSEPLATTRFSSDAKLTRGVVGVVEAPGEIRTGDEVTVVPYETPSWLLRNTDTPA